jgi:PAS domain S-box-containing protein
MSTCAETPSHPSGTVDAAGHGNLLAAALDALPLSLLVVDDSGRILTGNAAWRTSEHRQQLAAGGDRISCNYPEACEALGRTEPACLRVAATVRSVLTHKRADAECTYDVGVGAQRRSFLVRIARLPDTSMVLVTHEDITGRVNSKRALADSERMLRMVLRVLPVGVKLTDANGQTLMSNPAAKSLGGEFRLGTAGMRVLDMAGRTLEDSELPAARALATGQPVLDQTLQIGVGGSTPRIVSCSALPLPGAPGAGRSTISVQLDITERARAEANVRDSENKLRTLLTSVSDGVIGMDPNGRAIFCNPAADVLLALPAGQIIGRSVADLVGEAADADLKAHYDTPREVLLPRTGGEPLVAEFVLTRAIETGRGAVAAVLTIRDITQRRALQQQLGQSHKLEAIGQLAAGIAHEINTPTQYIGDNLRFLSQSVRDIIGAVDTIVAAAASGAADAPALLANVQESLAKVDWDYLRQECPRAVDDSIDGVERIARIVSSMKEFAHPDTQDKQTIDLNRIITSAANVCRHEWKQHAELELELDPALPPIAGYAGDIGQVLVNLIVNAAHAVGEKGTAQGRIVLRSSRTADGVQLAITDNGVGIPDHLKPRIFEQFYTTKPVGKGTGQGLSLVHRIIVNRHGGSVRFDSTPGVGTTFFLSFPLA